MSQKEEEFPFQQFLEALQESKDLRKGIKTITTAICQKNIYWTYSAMSTLIEILKSKDQQPFMKCRSLEAATIVLQTCEYPVLVFVELYLLPILTEIANYRGRKSDELISHYFQQTQKSEDSKQIQACSRQFVQRGVELIFFATKIKPYRTVETQELKQQSLLNKASKSLKQKGIQQPKKMQWCNQTKQKQYRKLYLQKLKKFGQQSEEWTQFLLVNLLEEIQTNKKELLELRLMLGYGESFLTSAVINFCEEELLDITENLDLKKKYLGVLNQLVRNGDIEAIIMVKNSEFLPGILAHISKLPGQQGVNAGEAIFPQVKASKQVKREFYVDFMRCLETWALTMPEDYDSEDFNIKSIYQHLKNVKKFKFPENMLLKRYEKQIKENIEKNKQRNDRLLQILQNMEESKQQSLSKPQISKMSNILQKTTMLAPAQLQIKLEQIKRHLKELTVGQESADTSFKVLVQFKDNWITYLQSLDFEGSDEAHLESLVNTGEKCVEQIQLIVPLHASLSKGKLTFKQFKQKVCENLQFHADVSQHSISRRSALLDKSKSIKASKLALSKMGKSKLASKIGKSLLDKIKAKSRVGDKTRLNMSKAMDRSNMLDRSRCLDKSRSHNMDISKHAIETSPRKQNNQGLQTLNFKNGNAAKEPQFQDQQSVTKNYQIPDREESTLKDKVTTPNKQREGSSRKSQLEDRQTSKKEISRVNKIQRQDEGQEEKIIRVADYEVEAEIEKKQGAAPRLSHSREKSQNSSRLLMRRGQGSRLDKSGDSRSSLQRRSVSGRKVKQSSLYKKSQGQQSGGRKTSQPPSVIDSKPNQNLAGQIQEVKPNEESPSKRKEDRSTEGRNAKQGDFGRFNEDLGQISSIHSDSNLRVPHHSSEKVLNLTAQISDINYSKEFIKGKQAKQELVQYMSKAFQSPLAGDYYESPETKRKNELFKKKVSMEEQKPLQKSADKPKFQNLFQKNGGSNEEVNLEHRKAKRQTSENQYLKLKVQTQREQRHTTKHISSFKQLGLLQTKKEIEQAKSLSPSDRDLKAVEEQKNKEIEALRRKIQQLQKESMSMKMKLAAKDNQIRSIKSTSKNGSERGFAHFTVTSQSNFEKSSLRSSSASRRGEMTPFERQVESGFRQYLQRVKGSTFRKSLLKLKCLVHRTDELEIGCLSQRCQDMLQSTLYVTPHRYDMLDFSISVIHDHRLKIKVAPQSVKVIPALKQQKIHLMIQVQKIPFCLPQFEINYKADSQYCSNYNRLTLPLAFNKFCEIRPLSLESKTEKHLEYVKTDNFKVNPKVVKLEKLKDSFPNFLWIPSGKGRDQQILAANCQFGGSVFNLMINIQQKWTWIEGFLIRGQLKAMNFLICTIKDIIDGSKK